MNEAVMDEAVMDEDIMTEGVMDEDAMGEDAMSEDATKGTAKREPAQSTAPLPRFAGIGGDGTPQEAGELEGRPADRRTPQAIARDKMRAQMYNVPFKEESRTNLIPKRTSGLIIEGPRPAEKADPNAIEATLLRNTLCVELRKMGQDFLPSRQPDGTYLFQNQKDRSIELTPAELRSRAQTILAMHQDYSPAKLTEMVEEFPQWIMDSCYILPENDLRYVLTHQQSRLRRIINEMKQGAEMPTGNWAGMAQAGKQAREAADPLITGFQWAMFGASLCILGSGIALGSAFALVQGAFQLAWSGIPRQENGLKDVLFEALEPMKLTLTTAGPTQRMVIEKYYLNDNALVYRYFNEKYPSVPFPERERIAKSMRTIK